MNSLTEAILVAPVGLIQPEAVVASDSSDRRRPASLSYTH